MKKHLIIHQCYCLLCLLKSKVNLIVYGLYNEKFSIFSHHIQVIFGSYNFGQKKSMFSYRSLPNGTVEVKIHQRQFAKQSISQQ